MQLKESAVKKKGPLRLAAPAQVSSHNLYIACVWPDMPSKAAWAD